MTARLFFFLLIALGLTACQGNADADSGSDEKPMNVLYIMADDLAYQAISAYGLSLIHI